MCIPEKEFDIRITLLIFLRMEVEMNTKLTLSLDQKIIEEIKAYAKEHKVSLSKMVENYFSFVVKSTTSTESTSPLVKELTGIIQLPTDFNEREAYTEFLTEKFK